MNLLSPICFESNRVYRGYSGGMLLGQFTSEYQPSDGDMPEDWLASIMPTTLEGEEGLSRLSNGGDGHGPLFSDVLAQHGRAILGDEHVEAYGNDTGLRCVLADYAEPQPIWPAPNDGLYEAWTIIATRQEDMRHPYILLGLNEDVTEEDFAQALQGEPHVAESMMQIIPIQPSQTYLLPPNVPRAVGGGVFMLKTRGIIPEVDLPEMTGLSSENFLNKVRMPEQLLLRSDEGYHAELVGSLQTEAFGLWRAEVVGHLQLKLPRPFGLVVCMGGEGRITWAGGSMDLGKGDCFLQPYGVPWIEYQAYGRMSLIIALPPAA